MTKKRRRDVERVCSAAQFVAGLRRLAEAVEKGERFEIQIAGQRIHVPAGAEFSIEHEREGTHNEIEFQVRWNNA